MSVFRHGCIYQGLYLSNRPHNFFIALLYSFFLVVLGFASAMPLLAAEKAGVSDLEAVYIFNFIRFTDWPEESGIKPAVHINLQVVGDPAVLATMQAIGEKPVAREMGLVVASCPSDSCIRNTSVLFVGNDEPDYERLLALVAGRPVLTISDIPGFASHGGMIEIKHHNKKLTFIVNLQRVRQAGLYISAQLLALGEIIGRDHE